MQMKLPTAQNLQSRFAEGEMTNTHPVEDAMHYPPVSIFGSQIGQFHILSVCPTGNIGTIHTQ